MFNPLNLLEPAPFSLSNGTDNRSPDKYVTVIEQFNVPTNPRYQPRNGETFCNVASWDISRALCAEIPHWVNGQELTANLTVQWLSGDGSNYGWKECDLHTAQANALNGMPTVVTFYNTSGHGHIGFMLPDGNIVAAGLTCVYDVPIVNSFGNNPVQFFVHA